MFFSAHWFLVESSNWYITNPGPFHSFHTSHAPKPGSTATSSFCPWALAQDLCWASWMAIDHNDMQRVLDAQTRDLQRRAAMFLTLQKRLRFGHGMIIVEFKRNGEIDHLCQLKNLAGLSKMLRIHKNPMIPYGSIWFLQTFKAINSCASPSAALLAVMSCPSARASACHLYRAVPRRPWGLLIVCQNWGIYKGTV